MKNIAVRTTSQIPIYQQLFDQVSAQIISGDLKPDEPLPSIRGFAKEIRVSIITIKKAWELLESNGYIYTIKGKGSYVMNNTKSVLKKKKTEIVREILDESIKKCKEYLVSKEELLGIIEEMYDKE